ncbi:LysR family transcriptional regulator [Acidocella sp.]|jgi:DNA-binding transcriptional LysR family regulator|uniref:LysR family transcriptional regulator n=1 Tax=Acidocella sp. TaxID=50710 RepID=UPI0026073480|nr:LysR family transcriptional regulator [Acidocella sp.]
MELRHLRYFLAVAQERSFTRAAERLHVAQPPLSRQIQQLEAELGMELFDRDARPLKLTEGGRLLVEQATGLLERLDGLQTSMRRLKGSTRQRFVIGFAPSTMYAALPNLIRRFRASAPQVELSLVEMISFEQLPALKEGRIDVGFGRVRVDDPAVRRDVLRHERLVVALPAAHRLAAETGPLPLSHLADEPLIIYPREPRPSYADQVISLFKDRGHAPEVVHEAKEVQTAIGLVAAEEGVCIVPTSLQRSKREDIVFRELSDPDVTSPIIMSRRAGETSPWVKLIGRVIIETYEEWGWPAPKGIDE